ncbi:hypothetical protein [Nitrosospira multiformis]|nr:hypothetical protein [Nitrosospira multiformis]
MTWSEFDGRNSLIAALERILSWLSLLSLTFATFAGFWINPE